MVATIVGNVSERRHGFAERRGKLWHSGLSVGSLLGPAERMNSASGQESSVFSEAGDDGKLKI